MNVIGVGLSKNNKKHNGFGYWLAGHYLIHLNCVKKEQLEHSAINVYFCKDFQKTQGWVDTFLGALFFMALWYIFYGDYPAGGTIALWDDNLRKVRLLLLFLNQMFCTSAGKHIP